MPTPEEEIRTLDQERAGRSFRELTDKHMEAITRSMTPELLRIPELKSEYDSVVRAKPAHLMMKWTKAGDVFDLKSLFEEDSLNKNFRAMVHRVTEGGSAERAEKAVSNHVRQLYTHIKELQKESPPGTPMEDIVDQLDANDRPIAEVMLGVKPVTYKDANGRFVTEKLNWGKDTKNVMEMLDQGMLDTISWHHRCERVHTAEMKMLEPYGEKIFKEAYDGKRENIPEPGTATSQAAQHYLARQNAIRLQYDIYKHLIPGSQNVPSPNDTQPPELELKAFNKLRTIKHENGKPLMDEFKRLDQKLQEHEDRLPWGRVKQSPSVTINESEPLQPNAELPRVVKVGAVGKV